jgi:hypothetical protein
MIPPSVTYAREILLLAVIDKKSLSGRVKLWKMAGIKCSRRQEI